MTRIALDNWRYLDGYAVAHNLPRPDALPLDRFCHFVWFMSTRNAEKREEIDRFERQLWLPPPGEVGRGPWAPEAETAAFGAFRAAVKGSPAKAGLRSGATGEAVTATRSPLM